MLACGRSFTVGRKISSRAEFSVRVSSCKRSYGSAENRRSVTLSRGWAGSGVCCDQILKRFEHGLRAVRVGQDAEVMVQPITSAVGITEREQFVGRDIQLL